MADVLPPNDRNFIVTRDEFRQLAALVEQIQAAMNHNAQIIDLHQHILAKFVPEPLLQKACDEYHAKTQAPSASDQSVN